MGAFVPSVGIVTLPSVGHGPASSDGYQAMRPPGLLSCRQSDEGAGSGTGFSSPSGTNVGSGRGVSRTRGRADGDGLTARAWPAMPFGAPTISPAVTNATTVVDAPRANSVRIDTLPVRPCTRCFVADSVLRRCELIATRVRTTAARQHDHHGAGADEQCADNRHPRD